MLSGIIVPTSGEVTVNGLVPYKNRIQNAFNIGVVFGQKTQLWWDIPLIESFRLSQKIYKIPKEEYEKRLDFFSELLDLHEFLNTPVRQLSLGQRMRGEVVLALLHNPPILYLDEPTIGLDVISKEKLRNFIKEQNRIEKTTIILTTHDMADIEMLSSRIVIINKGKILVDDSMYHFRRKHQTRKKIKITLKTLTDYPNINNAQIIEDNGFVKTFEFDPSKVSDKQILEEIVSKYDFTDVTVENESIDSIIKRYL
jgi:ABC-2 type transport system ATP-binding protein